MQAGPQFESHANNGILHFIERTGIDGIEQWHTEKEVTSEYFRDYT